MFKNLLEAVFIRSEFSIVMFPLRGRPTSGYAAKCTRHEHWALEQATKCFFQSLCTSVSQWNKSYQWED